jgi:hypothetical protein
MERDCSTSRHPLASLAGLLLAGLLAACSGGTDRTPAPPPATSTGGSSATGGSVGAASGGTGGSSSSASGGSGGSSSGDTGGSGGSVVSGTGGAAPTDAAEATGGSGGKSDGGGPATSDGGPPPSSGGKHPVMPGNALVKCGAKNYNLPGASVDDFCAFYEMYCPYDPTGMMLNNGQTPAQRAGSGSTAPWFYKDYADCVARYNMATDTAKSCRAGQLCTNKAGGCTHSTGHFSTCP